MRMLNMSQCGFKTLYEGIKIASIEKMPFYKGKLAELMSHCTISMVLDEITGIELIYLHRICSTVTILTKTYGNCISEKEYVDAYQEINNLLTIHDQMVHDEDITKEVNPDNILPIGSTKYEVHISFVGPSVTFVTGALIERIFTYKNDDGESALFKEYPGEFAMNNVLYPLFVNNFYKGIHEGIASIDLLSDYMLNRKFYQYADNIITLTHVNTAYGEMNFIGNTNEGLTGQINVIKETTKTLPYIMESKTHLHFVLKTTMSTYITLLNKTNIISDTSDMKIVFNNTDCAVSDIINAKYGNRATSNIDYITKFRLSLKDNEDLLIQKFNLILGGQQIVYCIKVAQSDVAGLIDILKANSNDEINTLTSKLESIHGMIDKILG